MLNHLGHCARYTQAFELETLLAEYFTNTYQKPVPKASLFYFVCDDNDLYEETLSEEGVTHGTTGIVVRPVRPVQLLMSPIRAKQLAAADMRTNI